MSVWTVVAIFNGIIALFCALTCGFAWISGFRAGKSRAISDGSGICTKAFAAALARIMDVQADGGDNPVAYTQWAISKAQEESNGK